MGSGKTSWAIQYMDEHLDEDFLYITPFLDEVDRIIEKTKRPFSQPVNKGNGKLWSMNDMLAREECIAATHELFRGFNSESKRCIENGNYTLILDEVLNVLEPISIKPDDIRILKDSGCITINDDGYVIWNPDMHEYDTAFNDFKLLAENNSLICVNGIIFMWKYPPDIFKVFKKIYILTYMFDASILKYYFDLHGIEYVRGSITHEDGKYKIGVYKKPDTSKYAELIHIYEGKMNTNIAQKNQSFSKSWYETNKSKTDIKQLKDNIRNYIRNIRKVKAGMMMWTTFKDYQSKLQGKGYTKGFVSCNCRSTNEYADIDTLAYCVNIYLHPAISNYFIQKDIPVNQDAYALSEMLQWIWRSKIRTGNEIYIYIPSIRMRKLLYEWMNIEYV